MREFEGRVALVTGGASGIGRAVVQRFATAGAAVSFCTDDKRQAEQAAAELRERGVAATGVVADISQAADMRRFVERAVSEHGGIDILVHSAGIQRYGSVVETEEELWDAVLDVNLKGAYLAARFAIPRLRARGGGSIINIASVQASVALPRGAAYAASKGGLVALTRAMAVDHAADNIRVNAICPGAIDTPMLRWAASLDEGSSTEGLIRTMGRSHPLGRVGRVDEVAELVAFLASERSSFVTGAEYRIDGGLLAGPLMHRPHNED